MDGDVGFGRVPSVAAHGPKGGPPHPGRGLGPGSDLRGGGGGGGLGVEGEGAPSVSGALKCALAHAGHPGRGTSADRKATWHAWHGGRRAQQAVGEPADRQAGTTCSTCAAHLAGGSLVKDFRLHIVLANHWGDPNLQQANTSMPAGKIVGFGQGRAGWDAAWAGWKEGLPGGQGAGTLMAPAAGGSEAGTADVAAQRR